MLFKENEVEILIGTYEDYVVGYQIEAASKRKTPVSLEQSFAIRGHSGSVKCLAGSLNGHLVLSAGFDEMVNVLNLKKRKLLQTAEIAVICASFVGDTHVICGCDDGSVLIYEITKGSMNLEKTLCGHKGSVTSISVHPSGKVLLSLSKDNTMRTWNLIKGRCAYVTNIKSQAHIVQWSKTGNEFVIAANNEIYLYNKSGNLQHSIAVVKRINSTEFITNNILCIASDSGDLELLDLTEGKTSTKFKAHEARIKSIKSVQRFSSSSSDDNQARHDEEVYFTTASSDGCVKLWSMVVQQEGSSQHVKEPVELACADVGARLTCMTTVVRSLGCA